MDTYLSMHPLRPVGGVQSRTTPTTLCCFVVWNVSLTYRVRVIFFNVSHCSPLPLAPLAVMLRCVGVCCILFLVLSTIPSFLLIYSYLPPSLTPATQPRKTGAVIIHEGVWELRRVVITLTLTLTSLSLTQ